MINIEVGVFVGIVGIIFGWGASWAAQGTKLNALKETVDKFLTVNANEHSTLLRKMDALGHLEVRVSVLETKVFGVPYHTDRGIENVDG